MTNEFDMPEPAEEQPETAEPAEEMVDGPVEDAAAEEPTAASDFTGNEGMVAIAGLILLAVWLVFEVIMGEYGVPTLGVVMAAAAALLPRLNRESVEEVHRLDVLMKILGYGLAIVGLTEIIDDLRFGNFEDFISVVAGLAAYAAYAMAFLGARAIKT